VTASTIVKRDPPLLIVDPVSEPHSREWLVLGPRYGFGLARRIEQVSAGCGRPGGSGVLMLVAAAAFFVTRAVAANNRDMRLQACIAQRENGHATSEEVALQAESETFPNQLKPGAGLDRTSSRPVSTSWIGSRGTSCKENQLFLILTIVSCWVEARYHLATQACHLG
jgi:hypothetical protein